MVSPRGSLTITPAGSYLTLCRAPGSHAKQVTPDRVRQPYPHLGAPPKMLIDLGCSSHNAMWEKNHLLLFRASREWLESGTVNGAKDGVLRLGY